VPRPQDSGDNQAAAAGLPVTSLEAALDWYDSERENLVAAARQASAAGLYDIAWRLPCTLFPIFSRRRNMADCVTMSRIAVAAARVAGHRLGEAWALQNLGQALAKVGDKEALVILEEALAIRRELNDHTGEAQTAVSLADAYHKIQGANVAYDHSLRCLEILRGVGNASLLGTGLVNHGEYSQEIGRLDEAAECFREAYQLWQEIGGYGQGYALHNLGHVHLLSGRFDEAIACLADAHRLHQASGDLIGQATTLKYLGQAQQASGNAAAALEARDTALAILEGLKQDVEVAALHASIVSASEFE
jgi:tetratricopeptide (TPR) repeat protein